MTNTEAILTLINRLSEVEFAEILGGMAEQIRRERWDHLIDQQFKIETYEDDLDDAREELDKMTDRKDELVDKIQDAISLCNRFDLEEGDPKTMQSEANDFIDRIKNTLE